MKITTTSRHYEMTPALREYAEGKIEHLKTYFDHLVSAHIIFALEKYRHQVEVTIHANGKDFAAHDESEDMYTSVDRVAEKLERQIRKYKGKLYKKKSPKLGEIDVEIPAEDGDEEDEGVSEGEIVPIDPIEFPVLRLSEAVAKLQQNGSEFSIFSNPDTNRVSVLFKRKDGTLGLIEAQT